MTVAIAVCALVLSLINTVTQFITWKGKRPRTSVDLSIGEYVDLRSGSPVRTTLIHVTVTVTGEAVGITDIDFPWIEDYPRQHDTVYGWQLWERPGSNSTNDESLPDATRRVLTAGEQRVWTFVMMPMDQPRKIRADVTLATGKTISSRVISWSPPDTTGSPLG